MAARSLFALLCVCILCGRAHAAAVANCSFNPTAPSWEIYDTCSDMCCPMSGPEAVAVGSGKSSGGCCSDGTPTCPSVGTATMNCCSVPTNLQPIAWQQSRQCYDPRTFGCCITRTLVDANPSNQPVYTYNTNLYNTATQKCCTDGTGSGYVTVHPNDEWNGIVNIGDTCGTSILFTKVGTKNEVQGPKFIRARCTPASVGANDCPAGTTCCIRPSYSFETNNSRYTSHVLLGECIDSTLGCCGGPTTGIQYSSIEMDPSQAIGNFSYMDYITYATKYQTCCVQDRNVQLSRIAGSGCSCFQQSDCPASSHCCIGSDITSTLYSNLLQCSSSCGHPNSAGLGCVGTCTQLSVNEWGGAAERCVPCGSSSIPSANPNIKCCAASAEIYDSSIQFCCPLGVVGSSSNIGSWRSSSVCQCSSDSDCPNGLSCCSNGLDNGGTCYDPSASQACCNGGTSQFEKYDTTSQVCCPVTGVTRDPQSCGCNSNSDCPNGYACCSNAGDLFPSLSNDNSDDCTVSDHDSCAGQCYNTQYQSCCNNPFKDGSLGTGFSFCNTKYQKCCDGECCTKGVERCKSGYQQYTAPTDSNAYQIWQHVGQTQKFCTMTEHSTVAISFYAWGFPAVLSLVSILIIIAGAQSAIKAAKYGSALPIFLTLGMSLLTSILGILLLWSVTWKYGMFTIVTNCAILFSLQEPGRWQKIFVNVLAVCCILYLIDPFSTNAWLTFQAYSLNTDNFSGLQELTMLQAQPNSRSEGTGVPSGSGGAYGLCTAFYGYFQRDLRLYDNVRDYHKYDVYLTDSTHGICRFDWVHAISVFSGILIAIQAFVVLIGLLTINGGSEAKVAAMPVQDVSTMEKIVNPMKTEEAKDP